GKGQRPTAPRSGRGHRCAPRPGVPDENQIGRASNRDPRLSAAVREVAASQVGVRSARAWANPALTFTPAITRGGAEEELLEQQLLELNGARAARTGIASAQLRLAQDEAIAALRDLVFQTKI